MKIISKDTNYDNKNINFGSMLVRAQDIPLLKEVLPDVVSLSSELTKAQFHSKFGDSISNVVEGIMGASVREAFPKLSDMEFDAVNLRIKPDEQGIVQDIFLTPAERKKLAKAIGLAEAEVATAKEDTLFRPAIFQKYWNQPKTACGKLKKLIDKLLKANPVESNAIETLSGDIKHYQKDGQRLAKQAQRLFLVEHGRFFG